MNAKNFFTTTVLCVQFAAAGQVFAANPPLDYEAIAASDANLTKNVNQQILADSNLSSKDWEGLAVATKNGNVTITGRVTTDAALKEIRNMAKQHGYTAYLVESDETMNRTRSEDWGG